MIKYQYYLFLILTLSSCAFHTGNVSTGSQIDCPMRSIVVGYASTTKFFGLGGLDKDALILEAKRDMYEKYLTNKGQKLTNFNVDFKTTYIFFYSSTKATVSADLYDCSGEVSTVDLNIAAPLIGGLQSGDSILYEFNGLNKGVFANHTEKGKCLITYQLKNGKTKTAKADPKFIFKTTQHSGNKNYFDYNMGDNAFIEVYVYKTKTKTIKPCTIIGLNKTRVLISYIKEDGAERILSVDKSMIRK